MKRGVIDRSEGRNCDEKETYYSHKENEKI